MDEFRRKQQNLNKKLNYFLISKYGTSGELPPKTKPSDLVVNLRKTNNSGTESKEVKSPGLNGLLTRQ